MVKLLLYSLAISLTIVYNLNTSYRIMLANLFSDSFIETIRPLVDVLKNFDNRKITL